MNNTLQEVHDFGVEKTNHKLFAINQNCCKYIGDRKTIENSKLRTIVKDLVERCDSTLVLMQSHKKTVSVSSD